MPNSQRILTAYWSLFLAENGTEAQKKQLANSASLPRPWDPATCTDPRLRADVWEWLEAFVDWFNHEYVWEPANGIIPPCWPQHPHLVHDIAVLADQRRRAAKAYNSNPLEEWQRYAVPAFFERLRDRLKQHCDASHQPSPARTRHRAHRMAAREREQAFRADAAILDGEEGESSIPLIDQETGLPINPATGQVG